MREVTNKFGTSTMFEISDIIENYDKILIASAACLSVTSDAWSFVGSAGSREQEKIVKFLAFNKAYISGAKCAVIVLGCQVTDLAILNDIQKAEKYKNYFFNADIYIGGCLGQRFDIKLPAFVKRIDVFRSESCSNILKGREVVHWEKPFWVDLNTFDAMRDNPYSEGNLFRNAYPLKIGAGCHGKCKYCTIRDTRGKSYEADIHDLEAEINNVPSYKELVIVSDSPTIKQMFDIFDIANKTHRAFAIRNIEPDVATHDEVKAKLLIMASRGLLSTFHCPIQSNNPELLKVMNRNVEATTKAIELMTSLRKLGVIVATNVIIDYKVDNGDGTFTIYPNLDLEWLNTHFDYWVWNPYFDGHWDRELAEHRFNDYIITKSAYNKAAQNTMPNITMVDVSNI